MNFCSVYFSINSVDIYVPVTCQIENIALIRTGRTLVLVEVDNRTVRHVVSGAYPNDSAQEQLTVS